MFENLQKKKITNFILSDVNTGYSQNFAHRNIILLSGAKIDNTGPCTFPINGLHFWIIVTFIKNKVGAFNLKSSYPAHLAGGQTDMPKTIPNVLNGFCPKRHLFNCIQWYISPVGISLRIYKFFRLKRTERKPIFTKLWKRYLNKIYSEIVFTITFVWIKCWHLLPWY